MNTLEQALRAIARDLAALDQDWALVGGFAVSTWAEPRFTRDVDVAVAVFDDTEAEKLVRALLGRGYRLVAAVEQDDKGRLGTARLMAPGFADEIVIDVLFASSGIEPELVAAAERAEIVPGLALPVARVGHLIALKLLARDDRTRPQDLADLHALLQVSSSADLAMARDAVRLIVERGFHRDRDLATALRELVDDDG